VESIKNAYSAESVIEKSQKVIYIITLAMLLFGIIGRDLSVIIRDSVTFSPLLGAIHVLGLIEVGLLVSIYKIKNNRVYRHIGLFLISTLSAIFYIEIIANPYAIIILITCMFLSVFYGNKIFKLL
jgi:uncharacterized membrane protein HdeD (DUF308 family)